MCPGVSSHAGSEAPAYGNCMTPTIREATGRGRCHSRRSGSHFDHLFEATEDHAFAAEGRGVAGHGKNHARILHHHLLHDGRACLISALQSSPSWLLSPAVPALVAKGSPYRSQSPSIEISGSHALHGPSATFKKNNARAGSIEHYSGNPSIKL